MLYLHFHLEISGSRRLFPLVEAEKPVARVKLLETFNKRTRGKETNIHCVTCDKWVFSINRFIKQPWSTAKLLCEVQRHRFKVSYNAVYFIAAFGFYISQ